MAGSTPRHCPPRPHRQPSLPSPHSDTKRSVDLGVSIWSPLSSTPPSNNATQPLSGAHNFGYDLEGSSGGGKTHQNSPSTYRQSMKRGADTDIFRDNSGATVTAHKDQSGDNTPKMSTAAQQARRKIAQPKSRAGRSTTPTGPSAGFGQQPAATAGGSLFSFGNNATAQSFPPPQQSQQFQFSVPSASSSFTFGSSNDVAQPVSNPFANTNGSLSSGGMGSKNENGMMMQTSQPSQSSSNVFGSTPSSSAPTTNGFGGFNFGGSSQQQTNSSNASAGFSFGQPTSQEQSSSSNPFASQPQTNGFSFGQTTQASSAPTLFGQSSTSPAPLFGGFGSSAANTESVPAPATSFKFGETSVVPTENGQKQEETQKPKPSFSFGQSTSTSTSFGTPTADAAPTNTPSKPAFSFGQPTSTQQDSQPDSKSTQPLFSFGQPSSTSGSSGTTPKSTGFSFGQPAQPAASSENNLFGAVSKPEPVAGSLFGRASPAESTSEPVAESEVQNATQNGEPDQPKNPFASLFANKSASDNSAESAKPKPTFSFGQSTSFAAPSSTSLDLSPSKPDPIPSTPADKSSSNKMNSSASTFSFGKTNASSGGLFSPQQSTSSTPSANLFNLNKATPAAEPRKDESASVPGNDTPAFDSKLSNFAASAGSTPFKGFSTTTAAGQTADSTDDNARPAKKRLFTGSSTPDSMAKSAGLTANDNVSSGPSQPVQPRPTDPQKPAQPVETVNRAVSTEGPPQIPRYLSADKYKSYDENWRLKALNRRFKQVVTSRDPDKHDLLNIIQNYLDHREAIGAPGLQGHGRPKLDAAGTKRKTVDVDDMQDKDVQPKKSRVSDANAATPKPSTSSNLFSSVASPKPSTAFSPAKPSDSATSNLFKSMIPGATNSSTGFTPFGTSPGKSTTPPSSPPKAAPKPSGFQVPTFNIAATGGSSGFANAFAKAAAAQESKARDKRKADEVDSDDEEEVAEWEKQYAEEQQAKKAKFEASKGGLKVGFVPSASSSRSNSPFTFGQQPVQSIENDHPTSGLSKEAAIAIESGTEEEQTGSDESGNSGDDEEEQAQDELPEDAEEEPEEEEEALEIPDIAPENSLFSRIDSGQLAKKKAAESQNTTTQSASNNSFKPPTMFGSAGKSTPDAPSFSPLTPATGGPKGDFVPTTTFNFTPTPATSTPAFGNLREGPIPGEGLFGSRPSTPQPGSAEKPANPFGSSFGNAKTFGSGSDNTWKIGSPIKFNGDKENAGPAIEVSAATPPAKEQAKPFSGLFGAATSSAATDPPIKNGTLTGFSFGGSKPPADSTTPAPGFLSAASHLTAANLASSDTSRATSPGLLSEAESVATDNTEDYSQDVQASLMSSNAGEENEEVLYESRAALTRNYKKHEIPEKSKITEGWNKVGSGTVKILKDKDTAKTRILIRAEPGANILLNTLLLSGAKYTSVAVGGNGGVMTPVAGDKGTMQTFMIKVKTKADADRLAKAMEDNKGN